MNRAFVLACLVALAALPASAADGPAPPPASGLVPVDQFFKGKVVKVEGRAIELAYDFSGPAQLEDFELSIPFRAIKTIARTLDNGQLRVTGTGSLKHKAVFDKSCGASATLTPVKNRDFGFAVTQERESEVFTLFCVYDRYFGAGDGKNYAQNMIIKFIPRDAKANKEGQQDWRYCARSVKPVIERGTPYKIEIERTEAQSRMVVGDWEGKGKEAPPELVNQIVSIYGYDADFKIDDLVVRGTLDAGWVEKNRVDLAGWKPSAAPAPADPNAPPAKPAGPAVSPELAARIRAKIDGWPAETKPADMAALLRDPGVPETLKAEAVQKAVDAGQKRLVPFLVDGLYADDEPSRRFSYDALAKLAGKTFPYRSDAPEDQRKKAIQAVNDYLKKHATDFQ